MPTSSLAAEFRQYYKKLTQEERAQFKTAVSKFVVDLKAGRGFRPGLRIRGLARRPGVYEMTWAPDGRATFEYGAPVRDGEPHIIWLRIGTHAILDD